MAKVWQAENGNTVTSAEQIGGTIFVRYTAPTLDPTNTFVPQSYARILPSYRFSNINGECLPLIIIYGGRNFQSLMKDNGVLGFGKPTPHVVVPELNSIERMNRIFDLLTKSGFRRHVVDGIIGGHWQRVGCSMKLFQLKRLRKIVSRNSKWKETHEPAILIVMNQNIGELISLPTCEEREACPAAVLS